MKLLGLVSVLGLILPFVFAGLIIPRIKSCSVVYENQLYVFGGYDSHSNVISHLEVIDLSTNTSSTRETGYSLEYISCTVTDNGPLLVGTDTGLRILQYFEDQFLPIAESFTSNKISDNNKIIDGVLYLIFPTVNAVLSNDIMSINLTSLETRNYTFPIAYIGAGIVISNNYMFLSGGIDAIKLEVTLAIFRYDMITNAIINGTTNAYQNRNYMGASIYGVHLVGNHVNKDGTDSNTDYTFYLAYNFNLGLRGSVTLSPKIFNFSVIEHDLSLIIYDGSRMNTFNITDGEYKTLAIDKTITQSSSVHDVDNSYFVVGGSRGGEPSGSVFRFDINSRVFTELVFENDGVLVPIAIPPVVVAAPTPLNSPSIDAPSSGIITPSIDTPSNSPGSASSDNTTIIVVVVVIATVVAAGIALTVILVKRNQKRKHKDIQGDVTFIREIGAGSYGKVYLAKWQSTNVAVKVSKSDSDGFEAETQIMINLPVHPNIVQVLGTSRSPDTGDKLLVLEYCNGGSLDRILYDTEEHLDEIKQLALAKMIALGMLHLHKNRIIHRDLSSRNILLHNGVAKISDFGMARSANSSGQGQTKTDVGPIRWMSPESIRNFSYSYSSDVWSFGIVIYEILARKEPHVDVDNMQVGYLIRDKGLKPSAPTGSCRILSDIMSECLQDNPDDRPSFEQICERL